MPVRIYSLAKELKLDSQELSDICAKAGITGKGSALASLTDEEAEKLKQYIASGGKAKAVGGKSVEAATDAPVRREDYVAPTAAAGGDKRPKVLASPAPKPKPPKLAEPAKPPQKESAPEPIVEPPADEPKRPEPIELRGPLKQIRELRADRKDQDGGEARVRSRPAAKPGPRLNLAPMPAQPVKKEQPKDAGPAPQKPDIKLSPEAMRGGKSPLSEHMRKHEQKRQDTPQQPLLPADAEARARERRRKEKEAKDETLLGTREQRQMLRKQQQARRGRGAGDEDTPAFRKRRGRKQSRRGGVDTAAPRKQLVSLQLPATLREFSEATGVTVKQVQGELLQMGTMASINTLLDEELIELLMVELGVEVELRHTETLEDKHVDQVMDREDSAEDLEIRPPVITFLGHVDHGKTSLLDKIIGIDVVSGESGGITQHIRAYEIEKGGRKLSFVDTPGHEAFTEMRARGANVTDIAVLVVAADDGVMPQTEEAISHARAAGVPIVIALNKIDLPDVDENRIFQQLAQNELLPTDWGGETELIRTSAETGAGIDDLLEMLLFIADDKEYKANPGRAAYGTCLEAQLHEGRGVMAKFIVQNGTLRVGDNVVCGSAFGRVRAMYDTLHPNRKVSEAGPSTPVDLTGLDVAPQAGERFLAVDDIAVAREIAETRESKQRHSSIAPPVHVRLEDLAERLAHSNEVQTLNLILRADVRGSIEAIRKELDKLEHPEVKIRILQASVGGVTAADVHLADASDAVIIGFNVVAEEDARGLAEDRGVQVRRYDIIYKITDDLKLALEGMLKPEERETELGRALVQQTFNISRHGTIAGCRVLAGVIERGCRVRVIRENRILGDYALESLKRIKDDAKEVREGYECGMKLAGFNDVKEGDIFEAYKVEEVARTL